MVGVPLLAMLKWLRLIHDDMILIMVADESGVVDGGLKGGREGSAGMVRWVQGAVQM